MLIDLGASLPYDGTCGASGCEKHGGGGTASAMDWIVDVYNRSGVRFDSIYAWEAANQAPNRLWKPVPLQVRKALHYFNVPVRSDPGSADNPWSYVIDAHPDDLVVVKIDIDHAKTENSLVQQLSAFDPHEPFFTQAEFQKLYPHTYVGPLFDCGC